MKKFLTSVLVFSALSLFTQNVEFTKDNFKDRKDELKQAIRDIEEGDKYYTQGNYYYEYAIEPYTKANKFNPNNAMLNYKLGICLLSSAYKTKAAPYLEKAYSLNPNVGTEIHYYLGRAYHLNKEWQKAIKEYKAQLTVTDANKQKEKVEELNKKIGECLNGEELMKKPVRVFIDNVGPEINSPYRDYAPVITADESVMMLTSRRGEGPKGEADPMTNEYYENIYVSNRVNGKWTPAKDMGEPVNETNHHDASIGLNADGSTLLIYLDDMKKGSGNIYQCKQKGLTWSKPEKLDKTINTDAHESSASLSADGKTLYFVSNKGEDNFGQHDIYKSTLTEKGKWGPAVNLGPTVNTKYDEDFVFAHPDGKTLYFSSRGHKTMGEFDVFKSVWDGSKWSTPENLGYPVNGPDDDVFFVLSASGKHGYYASFKPDGYGKHDIYIITFLGAEKPPVLNTEDNLLASLTAPVKETVIAAVVPVTEAQLTILKGVITDALTQKPLEAAIDLVDNTANQVIATFMSNSTTGKYLVSLPSGKNYGIAVKKEGYLFHSENFDIPKTAGYQEVVKDVALKNIAVGSKIILKNIFFDFDKSTLRPESTAELERLIKLLNDIPSMKIELSGHTDSKGSDDYNLKLSDNRAKAVVDYLVNKGISRDRLKSAGYGETKPIATNDTDEGRQLNRRTEFEILSK